MPHTAVLQERTPEAPACRFGVFEVDFATGELRKRGIRIKLQEQPYRILALLLEHPGKVVSRETIRKALWPDDTFVEFEQGISAAVGKLRLALGDSAENPRFVETVARHGYRFIAPLSPTAQAGPTVVLESASKSNGIESRKWQIAGAMVAVGFGLAIAMFVWRTRTGSQVRDIEFRATPLTSYPGTESGPSFSPDGTRVAFSWDGPKQDNLDIYVKLIGPGDPVRLTQDPADDHDPAWSPDGSWIAFLRDVSDVERAILLIPALGGRERTLARTGRVRDTIHLTNSPLLSWSADGKWLFTLDTESTNAHTYAVVRVSIDSGRKEQITFPPVEGFGERSVVVSPDGLTLLFTRQGKNELSELYKLQLSRQSVPVHQPQLVLSGAWIEGMAWTPDSRELIFSGDVGGKRGLWRFGVFGSKRPSRLSGIAQNSGRLLRTGRYRGVNLDISRTGRRLAYSQEMFDINIWRIGLRGSEKGRHARFISSTRDEFQPEYSPDGQKIAFQSDRSGCEEIWVCNADGSGPFQVTDFRTGLSGIPRWSPDGQNIAFDRLETNKFDIYVVNAQGGKPVRLSTSGLNVGPSWSRDGHWIYFASDRTGRFEVWKMQLTGGPEIQLTKNGGMMPLESSDGRFLYYSRSGGPRNIVLWEMPVEGGEETRVLDHLLFPRAYAVAKHGIYFLEGAGTSSGPFGTSLEAAAPLRFFDFKTRHVTTVGSVQGSNLAGRIAVSPDERWVLYGHDDGTGSDLMLVENFR